MVCRKSRYPLHSCVVEIVGRDIWVGKSGWVCVYIKSQLICSLNFNMIDDNCYGRKKNKKKTSTQHKNEKIKQTRGKC